MFSWQQQLPAGMTCLICEVLALFWCVFVGELVVKNKIEVAMPESWHLSDEEQWVFHCPIYQQWDGQCCPSWAGISPWSHSLG